jgi:hypothetical protein
MIVKSTESLCKQNVMPDIKIKLLFLEFNAREYMVRKHNQFDQTLFNKTLSVILNLKNHEFVYENNGSVKVCVYTLISQ